MDKNIVDVLISHVFFFLSLQINILLLMLYCAARVLQLLMYFIRMYLFCSTLLTQPITRNASFATSNHFSVSSFQPFRDG